MKRLLALAVLLCLGASAQPAQAYEPFISFQYAAPFDYAILYWDSFPATACAVRVDPLPEVTIGCGSSSTETMQDGAAQPERELFPGMTVAIVDTAQGDAELARITLAEPAVWIPLVANPNI